MKKSLVLLAGASMAFLGLPAVSHAQAGSGPFADVPTDHWAYQAVDTLQKDGIVIGYPDGTYGGRRPMTRYEFAVAIARLLARQPGGGVSAADLGALRSDLEGRIAGNTAAIDALRTLVNGFQTELTRLGQDVAAINARLDGLEARVNALGNRMDRDEGIIGSLADEQRRVKINGTVNLTARGDSTRRNGVAFLDQNGVLQGGASKRVLQSSDVYHDILLNIRGRLSDTATANVDLDFGNYLSQVGNTSAFPGGTYPAAGLTGQSLIPGTLTGANQYANVYKAYLDAAVKLGPLGGAELLVGRFGNQYTRYTLKQVDADIYTNLTQTDSGDIIGDGGAVNFKLGPAHINAFAIKDTAIQFSELYGGSQGTAFTPATPGNPGVPGNPFAPLPTAGTAASFANSQTRPGGLITANHAATLDEGVGGRVTFGAPEGAVLGATVEYFGLSNSRQTNTFPGLTASDGVTDPNKSTQAVGLGQGNGQFNRLAVYGVDFNGGLPFGLPGVKKGGVLVDATYNVSAHGLGHGFDNVGTGFRYQSTDDELAFALGGLQLKGGYQYVGPEYSAPGYWGRVGAWTNPTNVRGPVASLKFAFTPKLSLNADAQFYKAAYGSNSNGTPINSPLHQGDHLNRYQVGLGYGLTSAYGVDLGYENVQYDLRNSATTFNGVTSSPLTGRAGHPTESYVNIGLGHTISNNASIKLLYQIVHYDDHGTGFDTNVDARGRQDGNVAVGQFQLKF